MMKHVARFSGSLVVAVLLVGLFFAALPKFAQLSSASASSTFSFVNKEYDNGTIVPPNSPLNVWYDWVNVSGTQVVNYALYTPLGYSFPVPIASIVGQHLRLADGSDVFVASALDGMEVYRDLNGDGIPEANFTSGSSEILYFMYSNMSDSYSVTPIQKVMQADTAHYKWSFSYGNVYAYLQNATARIGVAVRLKLDHLTLGYDFSLNGNVSNLKTSFYIGKAKDIQVFDPTVGDYVNSSQFSFDGLSLSLLYATATYASNSYSTWVNGQPYNSTTTNSSAVEADIAQVAVGDVRAYDFIFGGNYTLNRDETSGTNQANIETYEAKAEAAAESSLPTINIYGPVVRGISFFSDELNLSDLFGGSWPNVNTDYAASSLVYRICFPVWDGQQIVNDPVYVGYLAGSTAVAEFPTATIAVILLVGTALVLVAARVRKHRSFRTE
jgi:hypothetical protein